jgi:transcriptional regulator with XRE-family HTH domain
MLVFAERLRKCRKTKGLTQKQAAILFKIGERHWQKYESGEQTPTFEGLIALADYFDVSIDYLVGRSDDPTRR